jgi:hypothetical protein
MSRSGGLDGSIIADAEQDLGEQRIVKKAVISPRVNGLTRWKNRGGPPRSTRWAGRRALGLALAYGGAATVSRQNFPRVSVSA